MKSGVHYIAPLHFHHQVQRDTSDNVRITLLLSLSLLHSRKRCLLSDMSQKCARGVKSGVHYIAFFDQYNLLIRFFQSIQNYLLIITYPLFSINVHYLLIITNPLFSINVHYLLIIH